MKTHNSKSNLRILQYFWKKSKVYKFTLFFFFFSVLWAVVGQEFMSVLILREVFDTMSSNTENREAVYAEIFQLIVLFGITHIVFTFCGWRAAEFINNYFQPLVMKDIEANCFNKLQGHSYHFFTNHFTGGLVSKTNRFVRSFEMIADIIQWSLWKIIILFTSSFIVIYYFIPTIALCFLAWTICYTTISYFYSQWSLKYWRENATLDSKVTAELADNLTNIFNVKIFAGQRGEKARFDQTINTRKKARIRAWNTGAWMKCWQGVMMISFELIVIYLMINGWKDGVLTIGTIFAIQTFIWIMFGNLWELGRLFQDYSNALADSEEMVEILDQIPDILDPVKPQKSNIKHGKIEFKNVFFKYETDQKTPQVFNDFQLHIPAGQKVGLVGESGAGKSTFVNLLLRFMDVNKGDILIDGQNIQKITQDDLRTNIAYVPQEPILFHRTLAENISYSHPDASKKAIIKAAKHAHAHEFIQRFPDQYETLVGERGVKLSGGQKQRVAIARAMLKDAPILILDEATSSLDSKAEKYIQEALELLMQKRTTLVIAHRLSTLRQMDRIIVFENGKIIEDGNHQDLIQKKQKYAELWEHQSGGFIA